MNRPRPPPPELAPLPAGNCAAGRAVEHGRGEEAEWRHAARTQYCQSRPIPRLVTAGHVGRSDTPAEPSPWLAVTAPCPGRKHREPPLPRAAGTGATVARELQRRTCGGTWPWRGGRAVAFRELNSKSGARRQLPVGPATAHNRDRNPLLRVGDFTDKWIGGR